jgi:hypothetical protein
MCAMDDEGSITGMTNLLDQEVNGDHYPASGSTAACAGKTNQDASKIAAVALPARKYT